MAAPTEFDAVPIPDYGPWLDIDVSALVRNAASYAARVGVPLLPMVKANGYGLGAVAVAQALETLGPWGFGVATLEEAKELRVAGITRPIVVFLPFIADALETYLALDARPSIGGLDELRTWQAASSRAFHLAVDTGMGRGGVSWRDQAHISAIGEAVADAVGYEGGFTHFHSADSDPSATDTQWDRFQAVIHALGPRPPIIHAANSAAGMAGSKYAGTMARPGIFLYGGQAAGWAPEAVGSLSAMVHAVRPIGAGDPVSYGATYRASGAADVATLGIGYADGVPRALGNNGLVEFGAITAPIAGRVTMDMIMVVVPRGTVAVGDHGTIFGPTNPIDAQALRAGTISYQLLTAVGRRVRRRYHGGEGIVS